MFNKFSSEALAQIFIRSASLIIAIIAYILLSKVSVIANAFSTLITILFPFLLGFLFAFILVKPQRYMEKKLFAKTKLSSKTKRTLSCLIVFFLFVLAIIAFLTITLSGIVSSMTTFASNITTYSNTLYSYAIALMKRFHLSTSMLEGFYSTYDIGKMISNTITDFVPKVTTYSVDFFSGAVEFLLALVSAVYMLLERESLVKFFKKLNYTIFDTSIADRISSFMNDAKIVFDQYIVGSLLDSMIIGFATTLGMMIMNVPYGPMIGLIIGVTNVIPVFGPFLGAIPVIILLIVISPVKALVFAIFILILQQIDGNLIKPVILSSKLGISGFWVLFSVTVGGSVAGVPGMFLGVPVFALFYSSIQRYTDDTLAKKKIYLDDED
ncbi:MAG: AI-2E family transporter [Holdemanella sp.]|nr:AI-2E family transporter [Holdemanella sp.]